LIDLRSLPRRWNEAYGGRFATLPEPGSRSRWPLAGMFALGILAGAAITAVLMAQRSLSDAYGEQSYWMGDRVEGSGSAEPEDVSVTTHRSNHRPKTTTEVK
jgi:hypothetical protein